MPIVFGSFLLLLLLIGTIEGWSPSHFNNNHHKKNKSHKTTKACGGSSRRRFLDGVVSKTSSFGIFFLGGSANAVYVDSKTGAALPELGEIEKAIPSDWDVENPFLEDDPANQSIWRRLDETNDSIFYSTPRFVEHVDDHAVQLLTDYVTTTISNQINSNNGAPTVVLDLGASWTSHIGGVLLGGDDAASSQQSLLKVVGLGMNEEELRSNPSLTERLVQDLNQNPILPYKDNTFTLVFCQLTIDYLTRPLEVLKEVGRVLKPGGTVHILFSNRLFLSKVSISHQDDKTHQLREEARSNDFMFLRVIIGQAVGLWTGADDIDHVYTVGCYLHFCDGGFQNIVGQDLSTRKKGQKIVGDPLYVVRATKAPST